MTISVVVPFFNEEESLPTYIEKMDEYAATQPYSLELLFVDDGSTDKSLNILLQAKVENYKLKIVKLSRNFGSHAAIRAGLLSATGDYCTTSSADLQEPFDMIGSMYERIIQGYDIVCALKNEEGRSMFSSFYAWLMQKLVVKDYPVKGFNCFMINRKVTDEFNRNIEAHSSIFVQILTMGFKKTYMNFDYLERKKGHSKWTFGRKIKLFIDSFVAFSYFPIRAISLLGIIMALAGMILGLYIVCIKLFTDIRLAAGWPTMISILGIGFGVTNISLGIIAEYLWRTLESSRGRPVFVIDEIIEGGNNS